MEVSFPFDGVKNIYLVGAYAAGNAAPKIRIEFRSASGLTFDGQVISSNLAPPTADANRGFVRQNGTYVDQNGGRFEQTTGSTTVDNSAGNVLASAPGRNCLHLMIPTGTFQSYGTPIPLMRCSNKFGSVTRFDVRVTNYAGAQIAFTDLVLTCLINEEPFQQHQPGPQSSRHTYY